VQAIPKSKLKRDLTWHFYKINYKNSLKRMQKELTDFLAMILFTQNYKKAIVKDKPLNFLKSLYLVIYKISAAVFQLCTKRQNHKVFTTSLYKIDWLLKEANAKKAIPDPVKEQRLA
jgi:hypothetical protein